MEEGIMQIMNILSLLSARNKKEGPVREVLQGCKNL